MKCMCGLMQAFVYVTADFKTAQNAVNEVMLWSRIVQEKGSAKINELVRLEYPYALTDPSKETKSENKHLQAYGPVPAFAACNMALPWLTAAPLRKPQCLA